MRIVTLAMVAIISTALGCSGGSKSPNQAVDSSGDCQSTDDCRTANCTCPQASYCNDLYQASGSCDQVCDQGSGQCALGCLNGADCHGVCGSNCFGTCAPNSNGAQEVTGAFICQPDDGAPYHGCSPATCSGSFDCWDIAGWDNSSYSVNGQDSVCLLSCNADSDCGAPGICCLNEGVTCGNAIFPCNSNPAVSCGSGSCAGACVPCLSQDYCDEVYGPFPCDGGR